MRRTLRFKLTFSYAALALLLVALLSLFVNVLFQSRFKDYVIKGQQQKNQSIVGSVANQFNADGGWNGRNIENIGVGALEQGIILKVVDQSGATVWDATEHNNGLCVQMLAHMADNMKSHYPGFKGGYTQVSFPVKNGTKTVGIARLGYYGPYYFTDNDLLFLGSLNTILVTVGVAALIAALLLGLMMSRKISAPLSEAVLATSEISNGSYHRRLSVKKGTKEITELAGSVNHLAESLSRQEELRKRMASDMAHELRTPLTNLQSSLEAMIDGVWEVNAGQLQSCHDEILRINRLVGRLENLERVEAENAVLSLTEYEFSELVNRLVGSFEPEFAKKGVSLTFQGDYVRINADQDKISQVVINLLSNSLKYTPVGGKVEVMLKDTGKEAELVVKDSGIGIPEQDQPSIFERLYRADQSRSSETGGSGLGLAIVKAIVISHGGRIGVKSAPGQGSTFTVILPKESRSS